MESEQFFLKWNNFENNLASGFADLLEREAMVDVTLAAEGKIVQAHKIILSICSSYFRNMFQANPCQHPIVVLKDVRYQELTDMLDFMYKGEANVRQQDLPSFLKLAETLKVKGLAGNQGEADENPRKRSSQSQMSSPTKDFLSVDQEEASSDVIDKEMVLRKKSKRSVSPSTQSESKTVAQSPDIKLELEECDGNFMKNVNNGSKNTPMKEERLSDISSDSYGENHVHERLGIEKNPGPSTYDENSEIIPQEFKFRFNPKRVPIWDFYNVNYDYDIAVCKVCQKIIKTRRKDGTRNVLSHMRNLHPEQYALALQFKEQWKTMKGKRCFDFFGRRRKSITTERTYWFCCKSKCPAKGILHSDGTFQVTNFEHNHYPDVENIRKKEKLIELKKLALRLDASGHDLLEALDIKENVKKHLSFIRKCRSRNKKQNRCDPTYVGLNYTRLASRAPSKELIFHSGYHFRQDSVNRQKESCKYWRCRVKNCRARAKTDADGNLTILKAAHIHPPDEKEETIERHRQLLKRKAPTLHESAQVRKQADIKGKSPRKYIRKPKKSVAISTNEKPSTEGPVPVVEVAHLGFRPPATDAETFSLEKLMADSLGENYCGASDF